MNTQTCYRRLPKYKYQLTEDFNYETGFAGFEVNSPFIKLKLNGSLSVVKNYAWDGASGPTIDTQNSMRASLIHDAFYQMLREGLLPQDQVIPADQLFRKILVEDGMSKFRAWYWYRGLRLANGASAKRKTPEQSENICLPA